MPQSFPFRHRELGYLALTVSDLAASLKFHLDVVGLEDRGQTDGAQFLRCGDRDYQLLLVEGPVPGLQRVAWEVEDDRQLDAAFAHYAVQGYQPAWIDAAEARALRLGRAFRIRQRATGIAFEYFTGMSRPVEPFRSDLAGIDRLGHVVFTVEHFDECLAELTGTMGFLVSDYAGDGVAFLRAFPNPLHHSFAIQRGSDDHLQHVNFMVDGMDTIGTAVNRLNDSGTPIVFGPGKHFPSGSIFLYFLDPDGMTFEYSAGMEEFPEVAARDARRLEPSLKTIDLWGGRPDPRFGRTGAIDRGGDRPGA
ncbi:VOC family protein [Sphingoaurantiacus capsulatus]|uniref:VOC family protein n=1 Tax=Sphingoaurantiacus capsulatus TaxID=1771310 RepID=A0ABV7X9V1_9SPHN